MTRSDNEGTYSTHELARLAGVSFRQVDYWARTDRIAEPERMMQRSGCFRRWSFHDVLVVAVIGRLRDAGLSLDAIEEPIRELHHDPLMRKLSVKVSDTISITIDVDRVRDELVEALAC